MMKLFLIHGPYVSDNVYVVVGEDAHNYIAVEFMKDIFNVKNHRKLLKTAVNEKGNTFYKLTEITKKPKYDFLKEFSLGVDWGKQWAEYRYRETLMDLCFDNKNLHLYKAYSKLLRNYES